MGGRPWTFAILWFESKEMEKQGLEGRTREGSSPSLSLKWTMPNFMENICDIMRKYRAPAVNCPKGWAEESGWSQWLPEIWRWYDESETLSVASKYLLFVCLYSQSPCQKMRATLLWQVTVMLSGGALKGINSSQRSFISSSCCYLFWTKLLLTWLGVLWGDWAGSLDAFP